MPKFAHLAERVPCPQCGADLALNERVGFQWGYCSYPFSDSDRPSYNIGDEVVWRTDVNGRIHPWKYFDDDTCNIGDPTFADVIVRECEIAIQECASCGLEFSGIGIVIRGGVIESLNLQVEWPEGVETFVINPNDELVPQPEWTTRPMAWGVRGGPRTQLVKNSQAMQLLTLE